MFLGGGKGGGLRAFPFCGDLHSGMRGWAGSTIWACFFHFGPLCFSLGCGPRASFSM